MTPRRLLALAASLALAGLAALTTAVPATARPAVATADRCLSGAPIPLAALSTVARAGCPLVGRTVTDGRVSLRVPPAGMSVAGDGLGRHGDERGFSLTNTGRTVRVLRAGAGAAGGGWYFLPLAPSSAPVDTSSAAPMMTSRSGSTAACRDRTFHLEHHRWARSLRYRVNLTKMPDRFSKAVVIRQVERANANMRLGRNTCGKPRLGTPASHYLGRTTVKPNIRAAGPTCGKPNSTNVVGFGALPGGLLGWTCYWYYGDGRMAGADMLIDNGPDLATTLPRPCSNVWDFEGTVTHEWGHAYGMAHTGPGHPNLTMQHELKPCSTYARTLGLGDWLGMKKMYGVR